MGLLILAWLCAVLICHLIGHHVAWLCTTTTTATATATAEGFAGTKNAHDANLAAASVHLSETLTFLRNEEEVADDNMRLQTTQVCPPLAGDPSQTFTTEHAMAVKKCMESVKKLTLVANAIDEKKKDSERMKSAVE